MGKRELEKTEREEEAEEEVVEMLTENQAQEL